MKNLYFHAPYQTCFRINCDCDEINANLYLHFGKYISENKFPAEYEISITQNGEQYVMESGGTVRETSNPLLEIDRFIFEKTKYDNSVFAIHGAAVEYNGKAYLFSAATTGGKTTLATYLTNRGMGYITDDCILLDRENFCIYPYNTPIHLRPGGVEALKKCGISLRLKEYGSGIYQRFTYNPENCVTQKIPLGKIFFISRNENENKVEKMTTVEKFTELMKSPITLYDTNAEYIRFISRLAVQQCFILKYSDLDFVKEVIRNG